MRSDFYLAFACRTFAMASAFICGLVSLRLYKDFLEPQTYVVIMTAWQMLSYLPLLDGGFRNATNRNILAEPAAGEKRRLIVFAQTICSYLAVAGAFLGVIIMFCYAYTPNVQQLGLPISYFIFFGAVGALCMVGSLQFALLIGLEAQQNLFLLVAANSWLTLASLWLALEAGLGAWAFPISILAGFLGTWPLALYWIRRQMPGAPVFSFHLPKEFWLTFHRVKQNAAACFENQIVTMVLYTSDVILVGILCEAKAAATYVVLARLFTVIRSFLQSASEVSWPIVAQRGLVKKEFADPLLKVNAWLYGSVMGAVAVTLIPFLLWFMGKEWTAGPLLLNLFIARFLITGLAAPASYFLFGLGEMPVISRWLKRELFAGVLLAILLASQFSITGVAWGFLLATALGTFFPLLRSYAQRAGSSALEIFLQIWWRAAVSFITSSLGAAFALSYLPGRAQAVLAGAVGMVTGLSIGYVIGMARRVPALPEMIGVKKWAQIVRYM